MMVYKGRAQEVGNEIIKAFQEGNIAAPLSRMFIRQGDRPMDKWSWSNRFLVALADMEDARTYKQWQEVGRQVNKGQNAGTFILGPMTRKVENEDGEEYHIVYGFYSIPVFDVSQTEGDPLPYQLERDKLVRELPLVDVAVKFGLDITTFDGTKQAADAYFSPGKNRIGMGVTNKGTFLHELMHTADKQLGNLIELGQHWRSETVAELGATILGTIIGLGVEADTGGAWRYISTYAERANIDPIVACKRVLDRTCAAIQLILDTAEQD